MKFGWLLLLIGLIVGFVVGIYTGTAIPVFREGTAGPKFVNGLGTGVGASVGLVLMIWLLKTCDRYLAAFSSKKAAPSDPTSPNRNG